MPVEKNGEESEGNSGFGIAAARTGDGLSCRDEAVRLFFSAHLMFLHCFREETVFLSYAI